jgi:hypothetical protein
MDLGPLNTIHHKLFPLGTSIITYFQILYSKPINSRTLTTSEVMMMLYKKLIEGFNINPL